MILPEVPTVQDRLLSSFSLPREGSCSFLPGRIDIRSLGSEIWLGEEG